MRIHDFRGQEHQFSLENHGFAVVKLEPQLSPSDFYDSSKVKDIYYKQLKNLLKDLLGAKKVEILEHVIRKRYPGFPISTGEDYDYQLPTSIVHTDFTPEAALEASELVLHIDPADYDRVQCLNLWKPLRGPLTDWPLALCDAQTVDKQWDCIASDVVTRTGFTENFQCYYNPDHKWYYLNNQLDSEVIIFRQTDTEERFAIGVPHASFYNPKVRVDEKPRESIETRAFVYY